MRRTILAGLVIHTLLGRAALAAGGEALTPQPDPAPAIIPYLTHTPLGEPAAMWAALRRRVKYVFILYQENRSFDSYFGSFPGANGLYSQAPSATPGFYQPIINTDGTTTRIHPFRIGPRDFAADLDDMDHSHAILLQKLHITGGAAAMDRFALAEEMKYVKAGEKPSRRARQHGLLPMAHVDCDTIPFLWTYAARFVLFDAFFQHSLTPSAPNAIALIAGQSGETQWVKHPEEASHGGGYASPGVPMTGNPPPFWGSAEDHQSGTPGNPRYKTGPGINQTYATLPLTFAGHDITTIVRADRDQEHDLADLGGDIPAIAARGQPRLAWGWYQEGYGREVTDAADAPPGGSHLSYVWHHNGPQYFGYIANNPQMAVHLHGLGDFFGDVAAKRLPRAGGVFYVRGGFLNIAGLTPADPDPAVQKKFRGDDDHPGYADSEISDALLAREVNAIAASPYWRESVIVITFDEGGGAYDHVPPRFLENGPDGAPLARGPRVPLVLISPYARAHVVSHEIGDHNAVIKFLDQLFGLPPLATLPEEAAARQAGAEKLGQPWLGPKDDGVPEEGDLLSAFDLGRVAGTVPPLPPDYATIAPARFASLPLDGGAGCRASGIVPVDLQPGFAASGIDIAPPLDFNPRPETDPSPVR
ncbi:MAG: phosphoesterase [Acidibrevibacterium sp.]|jgi:phospholipase C|uniref:phospholipase C n=1 Tax=Acidibrevibacterium fodinaquatile TaxID=1969806 RepID=UPI0023A7BAA3|nr:alkaline phosphatase family protein [Acidibrevibacterium fodinaquatile]MCA7118671.1 phosphoesterase [Acidibrevibacterium fodinaquatile]